ncbi:NgrC, partial [Enterobacter intestinihominis]
MTTAYRFMHRHTRNTLVARGWPATMDIDTSLNYSRGEGVAFYGQLGASDLLRLLPEIALRGLMPDSALNELL